MEYADKRPNQESARQVFERQGRPALKNQKRKFKRIIDEDPDELRSGPLISLGQARRETWRLHQDIEPLEERDRAREREEQQ